MKISPQKTQGKFWVIPLLYITADMVLSRHRESKFSGGIFVQGGYVDLKFHFNLTKP